MCINNQMKNYNFYLAGGLDEYGQSAISEQPVGTINLAINLASQGVKDSVLYSTASFTALTNEPITDKYIIEYGDMKLKVLYVNSFGKLNQAFMERMN